MSDAAAGRRAAAALPGWHYLGCAHTQANFKDAFWRSEILDYKSFETWDEGGTLGTMTLANLRMHRLLDNYQRPALDQGIADALNGCIAKRKASMPDAFV